MAGVAGRSGNPKWVKGKSGNPAGKPAGALGLTKKLLETCDQIAAKYSTMPLDYLMTQVCDENAPRSIRIDCAKAAAPYVHLKKPVAVQGGDPLKPITMVDLMSIEKMDSAAISQLLNLLQLAGAEIPLDHTE